MSLKNNTIQTLLKPTPCAFVWKNIGLTKCLYPESKNNFDLSEHLSLEKAVAELSKNESFVAQYEIAQSIDVDFKKNEYFIQLGYSNIEQIVDLKNLLSNLPQEFLEWCKQKKLSPKDFRVLSSFDQNSDHKALIYISKLNPSKSSALLILEYYFDLKLSDKLNSDHIFNFKNSDSLLKSLKKKRFQKAVSIDENLSKNLSKIQMSKGVKISVRRDGDMRLIKLEIHSSNPKELKKTLEKISEKAVEIDQTWNESL